MLSCMICASLMPISRTRLTQKATIPPKHWLHDCGMKDQTDLSTQAYAIEAANALVSFTLTLLKAQSRAATSIITGMAQELIFTAIPVTGMFSGLSLTQ